MKCQSVFGKLVDTMFPRADRCAGFFVWDGAQDGCEPVQLLAETDEDLKPLIKARAGSLVDHEVSWRDLGQRAGSTYGWIGLLMRIQRPENPSEHVWQEAGRCCRMLMTDRMRMPPGTPNILLTRSKPDLLLCIPTQMASIARLSMYTATGLRYDMTTEEAENVNNIEAPSPAAAGFNVRDWTGALPKDLALSNSGDTTVTSFNANARELPGIFRFMWECLRDRTYYLFVKSSSGMRNMHVQVLLPAYEEYATLDWMARLAARIINTEYSAGQTVFTYAGNERRYGGMGVLASSSLSLYADSLISMMAGFTGRRMDSVSEEALESESWFDEDPVLPAILQEVKEPGGAAWYRRNRLQPQG